MIDLSVHRPQTRGSLTLFPLLSERTLRLPYDLLPDALEEGTLTIDEVGSGSVPELMAGNEGEADVLVLDGEQVVGKRQNRTLSRTILLPAKSKTKIPVSCMEQGRWDRGEKDFEAAPQQSPSAVRREARELEAKRAASGAAASAADLSAAQGKVWSKVAHLSERLDSASPTMALDAVYRKRGADLERWAESFPPVKGQVGLLAFLGARTLGLDVIGGHELYRRIHDRLLRGYLLDALAADGGEELAAGAGQEEETEDESEGDGSGRPGPGRDAALQFVGDVRAADRSRTPSVGRGTYRVLSGRVIGGELRDGDRLPHLSAFPTAEDPGGGTSGAGPAETSERPIASPDRRARWIGRMW